MVDDGKRSVSGGGRTLASDEKSNVLKEIQSNTGQERTSNSLQG